MDPSRPIIPNPPNAQPTVPPQTPPSVPITPTADPAAAPYISNPLELIKPSWQAVKLNLRTLFLPALIGFGPVFLIALLAALVVFTGSRGNSLNPGLFVLGAVLVIAIIVLVALFAPYSTLVLLASARGQKVTFNEIFAQSRSLALKFIGLAFLTGLAVLGGLILLVIPGLIFAAWFSLASYVLVSENLGVVESMKRSKALVKGRVFEMWGLLGLTSALGLLNLIPILGSLVTVLLAFAYSAAPAVRYLQLSQLKASGAPQPPVHWANYLVLALAVITLPIQFALSPKPSRRSQPTQNNQFQNYQYPTQ